MASCLSQGRIPQPINASLIKIHATLASPISKKQKNYLHKKTPTLGQNFFTQQRRIWCYTNPAASTSGVFWSIRSGAAFFRLSLKVHCVHHRGDTFSDWYSIVRRFIRRCLPRTFVLYTGSIKKNRKKEYVDKKGKSHFNELHRSKNRLGGLKKETRLAPAEVTDGRL